MSESARTRARARHHRSGLQIFCIITRQSREQSNPANDSLLPFTTTRLIISRGNTSSLETERWRSYPGAFRSHPRLWLPRPQSSPRFINQNNSSCFSVLSVMSDRERSVDTSQLRLASSISSLIANAGSSVVQGEVEKMSRPVRFIYSQHACSDLSGTVRQ